MLLARLARLPNSTWTPISRQSRQLHLLAGLAFALFLFGSITIYSKPKTPRRTTPSWTTTSADPATQPLVEIEGLDLGRPFTPPTNTSSVGDPLEWLFNAVKSRFNATLQQAESREPDYPTCTLDPDRYEHTALRPPHHANARQRSKRTAVVSIAINLYNSAQIIPAQAMALLEAIAYLIEHNKVYISIFENASVDSTRPLLSHFAAALQALDVDGIFVHASHMQSTFGVNDRIVMLSEIRNLALKPLIPYASTGTLIFINDIVTCPSDILELVHQQRLQQADMVFGMDWGAIDRRVRPWEPTWPGYDDIAMQETPRVYDTWVGRGLNGDLIYPFSDPGGFHPASFNETWVRDCFSTQDPAIHERWLNGLPIPVFSGWGGMAAFSADLFTHFHLRFRSSVASSWTGGSSTGALGPWGKLISAPDYLRQDCPGESECKYIARDIWNLRDGHARIVQAPQVRTTYTVREWEVMRLGPDPAPPRLREGFDVHGLELIDWRNVSVPESVVCQAGRTKDGELLELWADENLRYGLGPMYVSPPEGREGEKVESTLTANAVAGKETGVWEEIGLQFEDTEDSRDPLTSSKASQPAEPKTWQHFTDGYTPHNPPPEEFESPAAAVLGTANETADTSFAANDPEEATPGTTEQGDWQSTAAPFPTEVEDD